ncbi:tetratricopeptide repeat protein [Undibacterium fentianense]|uniref:Tetratricopeptide repeat protein n=1 Tax=Undibacterium fentianense TaxID=2828728 RepID=A0A941IHA1_9BURK|nr:tetratricopeptide repeat protein [Undibacterium fentianense]MBR7800775.1 hypothetical protein [Undibacterium fentianense]
MQTLFPTTILEKTRIRLVLLIVLWQLVGCAALDQVKVNQHVFRDAWFQSDDEVIDAKQIFAASKTMQQYVQNEIRQKQKIHSDQRALYAALYSESKLQLKYDGSYTRDAAETFAARSGNCLSLVVMTAAFAKQMGLSVSYRKVLTEQEWSRAGGLYVASDHVNIVIGRKHLSPTSESNAFDSMVIDFLPQEAAAKVQSVEISESTVIAMFFNNRAAEALTRRQNDLAYWYARASILADPSFITAYNTLAVVYMRTLHFELALQTLDHVLMHVPNHQGALANLVLTLQSLGRDADARQTQTRLDSIQSVAPFQYFQLGQKALQEGNLETAKRYFRQELDRAPDYHEFHFWLGVTYLRAGEWDAANREFEIARDTSTSSLDRDLYTAKLNRLHSLRKQL